MPALLSQPIRRFTSPITSGPMPSPGRSSSLWVAMSNPRLASSAGGRSATPPRQDWQGARHIRRNRLQSARRKTERMTAAILFAFASAAFLGAGVVTSQLGLRTMEPLAGAAVSVPSFTLLFLLLSPILLAGEPVVWRGLPIFAAIGLFFPAIL